MAKQQSNAAEKSEPPESQEQETKEGHFFSIKQIAEEFNYSIKWINELVKTGRIKGIKPTGRTWRIPESEVDRIRKEGIPPQPRASAQPPEEIVVQPEHHDRVVAQPKEKKEEPGKEENEGHWPFNIFFK